MNKVIARCLLFVAVMLLSGCATSRIDIDTLRSKAEQGDAEAQVRLGNAYDFGSGASVNYPEAAKWYRRAAEQGHAAAQNNLGSFYQNGLGVDRDYKVAREWYEKSAAQGYAMAISSLGFLYDFGLGVETNAQRAVELYREAAEKGDPYGMLNLGASYQDGTGVPMDLIQAYKWLDSARFYTQFSRDMKVKWRSRGALAAVKKRMSRAEIAEAERQSQEWDRQHRNK